MKLRNTQSALATGLIAASLFTIFLTGPAFGQAASSLRMQIPYEFTFGRKVLPAGVYTFAPANGGRLLTARSTEGAEGQAAILTRLGGPSDFQDGSLVFDRSGGVRVLAEVWIPGTDGLLLHSTPKDHTHEMLLMSGLEQAQALTGQAVYNRTCRRCHGVDGSGDERADKFFKMAIPRLNSAAVQGKQDTELKNIVVNGSRAMVPVRMEDSGFGHRLPAEAVDKVIAHVRTFSPNSSRRN